MEPRRAEGRIAERNVVSPYRVEVCQRWNAFVQPHVSNSGGSWFARHICHGALIYMESPRSDFLPNANSRGPIWFRRGNRSCPPGASYSPRSSLFHWTDSIEQKTAFIPGAVANHRKTSQNRLINSSGVPSDARLYPPTTAPDGGGRSISWAPSTSRRVNEHGGPSIVSKNWVEISCFFDGRGI